MDPSRNQRYLKTIKYKIELNHNNLISRFDYLLGHKNLMLLRRKSLYWIGILEKMA